MVVEGVTAGDAEFPVNVAAVRMEIRSEAVSFGDCVGAGKQISIIESVVTIVAHGKLARVHTDHVLGFHTFAPPMNDVLLSIIENDVIWTRAHVIS